MSTGDVVVSFRRKKAPGLPHISNVQLGQFDVSLTAANTLAFLPTDSGSVLVTITKPTEKRIAVIAGIKVIKP